MRALAGWNFYYNYHMLLIKFNSSSTFSFFYFYNGGEIMMNREIITFKYSSKYIRLINV